MCRPGLIPAKCKLHAPRVFSACPSTPLHTNNPIHETTTMGNPVARRTDSSTHGGQIITSCQYFEDEGQLVARVGDILLCPVHGPNPIVTGCPSWDVEGKAVARTTSLCACGAEIIGGSKLLTCE